MTRSLFVIVIVTFCGMGNHGCTKKSDVTEATDTSDRVRTVRFDLPALKRLGLTIAPAGGAQGSQMLRVPGTIEYNLEHYAEVGSLVDGRITSVSARVGDRVKKGQKLATLVVPSIAQAQAQYISAGAAASVAKEHAERERSLLAKQLTTAHEAEVARADNIRSDADLAAAAARLRVLGVALPSDGKQIAGPGSMTLVAPIDGVVVRRDAVLGRYVQPNETSFVIADPSQLWASVDVYEGDLPHFKVNAEVELSVDAMPGKTYRGRVFLVEPQIGKESRALRARIAIDNTSDELKPGLFVRATIKVDDDMQDKKLPVPSAAVQPLGEGDVVFVELEPGKYEVRTVRVGRHIGQVVEILDGLREGERIVVEGAFLLRGEVTKQ